MAVVIKISYVNEYAEHNGMQICTFGELTTADRSAMQFSPSFALLFLTRCLGEPSEVWIVYGNVSLSL